MEQLLRPDEDIQVLKRLGLTSVQAKIYISLVMKGRQTIKAVAKVAEVDRSNAYREVQKLQEMALAKRIIGSPNFFEAIPVEDAIATLAEYKKQENEKTLKQAEEMLYRFYNRDDDACTGQDEEQFTLIPQNIAYLHWIQKCLKSIKKNACSISSLKRFLQWAPYSFEFSRTCLERGVMSRTIVEEPRNENAFPKSVLTLMKYSNYQIRCTTSDRLKIQGGCIDDKLLGIVTSPTADFLHSPCIFTRHPSFVFLFKEHFEKIWLSSRPLNPKESEVSSFDS
jgi:sugar-specific transcriptional regulator TrmB